MGVFKTFTDGQISEMIRLYQSEECCSKDAIGKMFNTSKRIVSKIFEENGVETVRPGTRNKNIVVVSSAKKFIDTDEYKYIAKHKESGVEFSDANNSSGALIRYIENNFKSIQIPSKYDRSLLYKKTGNYWHEQYFDIIKVPVNNKRGYVYESDISEIVDLYESGKMRSTHKLGEKYKLGHKKINKILRDNGVVLNEKNDHTVYDDKFFYKYNNRFKNEEGYVYKAVHKETGVVFDDFLNVSGALSRYISENNKDSNILKLESQKRKYFIENNEYWYEKYFEIKKYNANELNLKKCPYCQLFIDVSMSEFKYRNHLIKMHKINMGEHVKKYKEDAKIFANDLKKIEDKKDPNNWSVCKVCGTKLKIVNCSHLLTHNITVSEYKTKHGNIASVNFIKSTGERLNSYNYSGKTIRYVSKPEGEIKSYLESIGVVGETNRSYLIGKEIDFFSPEYKIGIEFNGNKWHSEWFGKKNSKYHLNKTIACNDKGVGLIHIFEDEYQYKKEILFHKLKHIFGKDFDLPKISGRKCMISEITKNEQSVFLDKFHIQGYGQSSVSLGAYYNDILVAVMSFKKISKTSNEYDLVRFASDYNYQYQGVASKILSHFIKKYNPTKIISFADRRWTLNSNDNLYTKLGFKLSKTLKPDYRYYNDKVDKYTRFHKFGFRKTILNKKYGLPLEWTETEMVKHLGYDRVWDCGLFKYELVL